MKITKENLHEIHQKLSIVYTSKMMLMVDGYKSYIDDKNHPDMINPYSLINDTISIKEYLSKKHDHITNGFLGFTLEKDYIRGESAYNENMGSEDMEICNNVVFYIGDDIEFDDLGNILLIENTSPLVDIIGLPFIFLINIGLIEK